jgi:hypothetical protein
MRNHHRRRNRPRTFPALVRPDRAASPHPGTRAVLPPWYRDGKLGYLADLPRVYDYVINVARSYPELADFVALLERMRRP